MNILTPQDVRKEKQDVKADAAARVRDLAKEEARLVRSVNDMRAMEESEHTRIHTALDAAEGIAQARIEELAKEVGSLEQRKAEALKPIDDRIAEVVAREDAVTKREDAVKIREEAAQRVSEENMEEIEALDFRKDDLDDRELELDRREVKVKASEESARSSLARAGDAWTENAKKVEAADARLLKRENAVAARESILGIRHAEQEKRQKEQDDRDVTLKSQYAQLEKSTSEFYKLKNEHHGG